MTKFNGKILLTEDITRKVNKVAIKEWGGWENQKMLHRLETVAQEAAEVAITEYDKIARAEERERCIDIAQKWYCEEFCTCITPNLCKAHDCKAMIRMSIRKAMEGGK